MSIIRSNNNINQVEKVGKRKKKKAAVAEVKYFDQFSSSGLNATGIITNISDVTQGADVTQRIGNKLFLMSIQLKLYVKIHPSQTSSSVRVMLILDKQGYNSPVIGDILESAFLASSYSSTAPLNWNYALRFEILLDRNLLLTQAAFQNGYLEHVAKVGKTASYIGAGTTFTNQIYLLLVSDETNVLSLPVFYYTTRLRFVDD